MKDLDQKDCNLCFARCKTQILKCLPFQLATRGGRLFFDGCYIRYDDYDFFNETLSPADRAVCAIKDVGFNQTLFRANALELTRNLSSRAPKNDGFSTGKVERGNVTVYGLAQCWELVNGSACEDCLTNAASRIASCPPKEEGRVLNAGCYLRYSTRKFYNNSDPASSSIGSNGGRRHLAVILAGVSSGMASGLILAAAFYSVRKKLLKKRREEQLGPLLATVNKSNLNFSYDTLEKATNYFASSNKLGQGGSGSVYKGILPDGTIIAVKRLFFNTRQWVDHFFNEVNLISGIHQKNLVKLLGCSITGPESLLVYEYVPNQSLHNHLFVGRNIQPLTWEMRYKIVLGTAEGLSYLHESKLRIIHRDIKLSNILLDDDFTPKIADFGLARFFPEDKTHISTAIAGTLGYMAPEYVVSGKLTEKADVYGFGVLVIEVITGKRNNSFSSLDSVSILQMVWNLYGSGRVFEAVDPVLEDNFKEEEASKLLQIGLLCVQASAELRPSMSIVVRMLKDEHEVHQPTQPPFLKPGTLETRLVNPTAMEKTSQPDSQTGSSGNSMTQSLLYPR